ncbi:hypothetical protein GCM10022210_32620 [Mucilaginibacter dorajii]|uniref:Uncharacterized protein n=1 Tax=Mucilaginibacter dorajii TaxID=692994 RepID=A0ABP7Q9Y4_9SPHI
MYRLLRRLWAFPSVFLDKLNKERLSFLDNANINTFYIIPIEIVEYIRYNNQLSIYQANKFKKQNKNALQVLNSASFEWENDVKKTVIPQNPLVL